MGEPNAFDGPKKPLPPEFKQALEVTPNAAFIVALALENDIAEFGVEAANEGPEFSAEQMKAIENQQLDELRAIDEKKKNPYHDTSHTKGFVNGLKDLMATRKALIESGQASPDTGPASTIQEEQAGVIAALFHDKGHSGLRMREIASPEQLQGEVHHDEFERIAKANGYETSTGLSNEELASMLADEWAKQNNLTVRQRIQISGMIAVTTYGKDKNNNNRTFGNGDAKPGTPIEKLAAEADLSGYRENTTDWMTQSLGVAEEMADEIPPDANTLKWLECAPEDALGIWLGGQKGFLNYIKEGVPQYGIPPTQSEFGAAAWSDQFAEKEGVVDGLIANKNDESLAEYAAVAQQRLQEIRQQYTERLAVRTDAAAQEAASA